MSNVLTLGKAILQNHDDCYKNGDNKKRIQMYDAEIQKRIREVEIQKIDLKIQNDNLKQIYNQTVAEVDKYAELFDFAPIAFFVLDKSGHILEHNIISESLLEDEHIAILNSKFENYIAHKSKQTFRNFLRNIYKFNKKISCNVEFIINNKRKKNILLEGIISRNEKNCLITASNINDIIDCLPENSENEKKLHSLVKVLQFNNCSIEELLGYTINEAILLTDSQYGYIFNYDDKRAEFTNCIWSENLLSLFEFGRLQTTPKLKMNCKLSNVIKLRKPVIVNDLSEASLFHEGYPDKSIILNRFIDLPVIIDDEIVAIVGVANKDFDYDNKDVENLTQLMNSAWINVRKKKIEELFKIQNEELKELNAAKDKFFSIIAHDLKSPFSGFLGYTKIMSENIYGFTLDELEDMSANMQTSASNLYKLLENLLEWSRMQRGITEFNPELCNLQLIFKQNIDIIKEIARQKNIEIVVNLTKELYVIADVPQLNTILRNLLSNAIKFTLKGGTIEVGINSNLGTKFSNNFYGLDKVCIYVKDSGIGMDENTVSKLFQIDKKVSRLGTENEPSTGLGLLLCKEFIEKHEGKIWVDSIINIGTTFYFTMPSVSNIQIDSLNNLEKVGKQLQTTKKILVSNVDYFSYLIIRNSLEKSDFELTWANNFENTLDALNNNNDFDLVLIDLSVNKINYSKEAIKLNMINQIIPDLPIILHTDCEINEEIRNNLSPYCKDYLSKPIDMIKLNELILKYL